MLKQSQGTLDNHVLEDRSGRNINGAALCRNDNDGALEGNTSTEVDGTSDGQMVQLNDLGDAANALLEIRHLFEVISKLDERGRAETVWVNLKLTMLQRVQV